MTETRVPPEPKADDTLTREEAAEYLGVDDRQLTQLLERYGVGRYYIPGRRNPFVYKRADLDRIKANID